MFCSKCGTNLQEGTQFCHNCGTKLTEDSKETPRISFFGNILGQTTSCNDDKDYDDDYDNDEENNDDNNDIDWDNYEMKSEDDEDYCDDYDEDDELEILDKKVSDMQNRFNAQIEKSERLINKTITLQIKFIIRQYLPQISKDHTYYDFTGTEKYVTIQKRR